MPNSEPRIVITHLNDCYILQLYCFKEDVVFDTVPGDEIERLYLGATFVDRLVCEREEDIQWCYRELLRWYSKNFSPESVFADMARRNHIGQPIGRVWYSNGTVEGPEESVPQ